MPARLFILEFSHTRSSTPPGKEPLKIMFPAILITAAFCLLAGYLLGWHQRGSEQVDSLTGLPDKRAFNEALAHAAESVQGGERRVICFLDLDHFKQVNDQFGHLAGDHLLEVVGHQLESLLPWQCYRWGGDEFASLLPLELDDACELAESLRGAIEEATILYQGKVLPATISIGLAVMETDESSGGSALAAADAALYQAKSMGRNMICTLTGISSRPIRDKK
jgi:diguanylate cyclase (GGDEF)-like protein